MIMNKMTGNIPTIEEWEIAKKYMELLKNENIRLKEILEQKRLK